MKNPKHVIAVSDLHLGVCHEQDDFRDIGEPTVWRDAMWEFFCRSVKKGVGQDQTLFILNGDVFDLWEIADDSELEGPGAKAAITSRIFYPANTPEREEGATKIGIEQVTRSCDEHYVFTKALRTLLATPNIAVRYHYGNHDHGMVNPALQQAFRDILGDDAQDEDKLSFGFCYRSDELQTYIEHGNQFAGADSYFPNVEDWREEAAGYYLLRYVWNRFQKQYLVTQPTVWQGLGFLLAILRRKATSQQQLNTFQFFIDYFEACDNGVVPTAAKLKGMPLIGNIYNAWADAGKPDTADDYFRNHVQAALDEQDAKAVNLPGDPLNTHLQDSQYTQGLMSRFDKAVGPFPRLRLMKDINLSIGHTHVPGQQLLWGDGRRKQRYLNSGTWTRDLRYPTYVSISVGDEQMALTEIKPK